MKVSTSHHAILYYITKRHPECWTCVGSPERRIPLKQRANGLSPSKEDSTKLKQILRRLFGALIHRRAAQDDGTKWSYSIL